MKIFLPYRFPEIVQTFGICVSFLFFRDTFVLTGEIIFWGLSLFLCIASAYWINDFFDFDDDRLNTRKDLHRSKMAAFYPGVAALLLSLVFAAISSVEVVVNVLIIAATSFLYSSPYTRFKSRLFVPFLIHFFMGIVFFQSAASLGEFRWTKESVIMALFWGLILGTGSLGNELVDQSVDERAKIKTVANAYPHRIRALILSILGIALVLLMTDMFLLGLFVTAYFSIAMGVIYFLWYFGGGKGGGSGIFRKMYRIVFVLIILSFHAEKILRN